MGERDGLWLDVLTFLSSLTRLLGGDGLLLAPPAPAYRPLVGDLLLERRFGVARRLACLEAAVDDAAFLGLL